MTKTETKLAVVILGLVAVCAALVYQGMRLNNATGRITALRSVSVADSPHLAVFFRNELHLLNASGQRVARQPLAELQLTEEPNDMDWVTEPDGVVQAWFFEDTTPRVVRCTLDNTTKRLGQCAQVMAGAQLKTHPRSSAVHLAVDTTGRRVFIADAKGHRVRALDYDGKLIGTSAEGGLFFPNRLRVTADQQLVVADNDNRRLVWMDISKPAPDFRQTRTLQSSAHPQARGGHTKVTDVAWLADVHGQISTLWMLAVAQGQQNGDVLVYGAGLKPLARASLGLGTDPLGIDVLGHAAVVADYNGIDLYRVSHTGEFLGPFGDAAFRQLLADERARVRQAALWTQAGWAAFAFTLVVGFVLAFKYGQKPAAAAKPVLGAASAGEPAAVFPRPGKVKIPPAPWFLRQTRIGLWLSPVLVLLGLGVVASLFSHEVMPMLRGKSGVMLGAFAVSLVALMAACVHAALKFTGRVLVITPDELRIVQGSGEVVAASPLSEVLVSPISVLVGRTVLVYRQALGADRDGKWIYDKDLLTQHLFPRLRPEQSVTLGQMQLATVKRLPRSQQLLIALMVVVALVTTLLPLFKR